MVIIHLTAKRYYRNRYLNETVIMPTVLKRIRDYNAQRLNDILSSKLRFKYSPPHGSIKRLTFPIGFRVVESIKNVRQTING